ncbi:hypothetical protein LOTGIDRAFT_216450 [Lottia gigantea]|uniref:Glycoside hydrolase family 5 domain-containing protein n=1 Tax=Lottia gigantea TaxID=225164 RepID=V3ZN30_LOTGI|nr:hypothetical protein LOTGIDRAFT_216450 [Lottia gigantea]ESO92793.1 hypothetical protein LOTGIDRAFT_216450 [Lottia gigantea]
MRLLLAAFCLVLCSHQVYMGRLKIQGTNFVKDGKRVFLSGGNQAWIAYGYDFGDHNYEYRKADFEKYLKLVHDNGGNSIRVWIHVEGVISPHFDSNGYVTGLDKVGTFIAEFKEYLAKAQSYNILIFPCLWNGAVKQNHEHLHGLIVDNAKLQSYIDKALIPWVKAVKDEPALGGWDIMNEFEGEIKPGLHSNEPCFDTVFLQNSGAGWAGATYSAQQFLRFINWQTDAIRRTDPEALVTAGSWNARDNTDKMNTHNLYSDKCLIKAGGRKHGTLNFFSSHSYAWQGKYDEFAPFKHKASDYGFNRPFVIAEFNQVSGAGMDITEQFAWAYNQGYGGAWTWHLHADGSNTDSTANQLRGMKSVRNKNDQSKGGLVAFKV